MLDKIILLNLGKLTKWLNNNISCVFLSFQIILSKINSPTNKNIKNIAGRLTD
jgi:hypothetical protein